MRLPQSKSVSFKAFTHMRPVLSLRTMAGPSEGALSKAVAGAVIDHLGILQLFGGSLALLDRFVSAFVVSNVD